MDFPPCRAFSRSTGTLDVILFLALDFLSYRFQFSETVLEFIRRPRLGGETLEKVGKEIVRWFIHILFIFVARHP